MSRLPTDSPKTSEEFEQVFLTNLATSEWEPHPLFSVFTQYDQEYYLSREQAFLYKYQCFYAVSKTICPQKIIEMGTCAGASGDAYLSAAPEAEYIGIDVFGVNTRRDDYSPWDPYEIAKRLFESRGFKNYQLIKADLRSLSSLPSQADFVIVDAAHDFDNAYADLKLALTAQPTFIFVDDADDESAAKPAIDQFLVQDIDNLLDYTVHLDYVGGGLVIKLKNAEQGSSRTMSQVATGNTVQQWRETASYWTRHHHTIRTMFTPLTRALIEHARILQGQQVLDVAGGAGEPSLTIAETVGPHGSVMCTDPVAEMLATAEREALSRGLNNIQFRQCTADSLPFADDSFDATVSRLGAMFFPDPLAALREMLRVTKPDGRVALAVWHKSELNPYSYLVTQVISRHVQASPVDPNAPDAFRFAEPGKLLRILEHAGAVDVSESVVKFDIAAPISVDEFWTMRSEISESLREKLKALSDEEKRQIADEVRQAVRPFFPDGHMKFPAQMVIVTGTKPS